MSTPFLASLSRASRISAARSSSAGVSVVSVRFGVDSSAAAPRISVDYELKAEPNARSALVLDGMDASLVLESVVCDAADKRREQAASRVAPLFLREGAVWDGAGVHAELGWPADSRAVRVPRELPRLGHQSGPAEGPLPRLTLDLDGSTCLLVAGIPREPGSAFGALPLLEAIVACESVELHACDEGEIAVSTSLATRLSTAELDRTCRLVSRILDHHGRLFGRASGARVLVAPAGTNLRPGGSILDVSGPALLGLRGSGPPNDVVLGARLAGIWWGGAIQLTGRHGLDLEAALRGVAGALWADAVGETAQREELVGKWRALSRGSKFRDRWEASQGRHRPKLHARMALELYTAFQNPAISGAVRGFLGDYWGCAVNGDRLIARLRDLGVDLLRA